MARILLIDDHPSYRCALSEALQSFGHVVTEAANGKAALKLLEPEAPELIITDIVMPEMEGIEFLLELRKRRSVAKIIAISAGGFRPSGEYLHLAKLVGASQVLAKPFTIDELRTAIAEVLPMPAGLA